MKLRPIEGDADVASVRSNLEALYADRDREWRSLGA
jgi:hypothetical protein